MGIWIIIFANSPWKCLLTVGSSTSRSCRAREASARLVLVMVLSPAACRAPAPRTSWQQRELKSCSSSARCRHSSWAVSARSKEHSQYSATIFNSSRIVLWIPNVTFSFLWYFYYIKSIQCVLCLPNDSKLFLAIEEVVAWLPDTDFLWCHILSGCWKLAFWCNAIHQILKLCWYICLLPALTF